MRPQDFVVVVGAGPLGLAMVVTLQAHGVRNVIVVEPQADRRRLAILAGAKFAAERLDAQMSHLNPPALVGRADLHGLPDVLDDPRTVVFECAGTSGTLTDICTTAPNGTRIIGLGITADTAVIPLHEDITKQLEIRFVVVYNLAHFHTAALLAGLHADLLDQLVSVEMSLPELAARWPHWITGAAMATGKTVVLPRGNR